MPNREQRAPQLPQSWGADACGWWPRRGATITAERPPTLVTGPACRGAQPFRAIPVVLGGFDISSPLITCRGAAVAAAKSFLFRAWGHPPPGFLHFRGAPIGGGTTTPPMGDL